MFPDLWVFSWSENKVCEVGQRLYRNMGFLRPFLRISHVDKARPAARGMACGDVSPPIAYQVAFSQIDMQFPRRLQDHARLWFAAAAVIGFDVVTDLHGVQRQVSAQSVVYGLDNFAALTACADIRLIGDDDVQITGGAQFLQRLGNPREDLQRLQRIRRIGLARPDNCAIDNAIAIEKYRASQTVSAHHFVGVC